MVNRVVLVGRLTRDPETRDTTSGMQVAEFSIAVTKKFKPKDGSADADFFRVKAFGQQASYVQKYLTKGRLVGVDGRLEQRRYEKDGQSREIIEVVADNVQGLDRPREDGPGGGGDRPYSAASADPAPVEAEYDPFADE